jgi:oxygen-independent coproporphyrinogen III oxidase
MKPYNLNFAILSKHILNSIKLTNPVAGIYIHIPFCKQACNYCNFHFSTNLTLQNDFTVALLREIELRVTYLGGETIESIYFGGGTPSLLPSSSIAAIMESIYRNFSIHANSEITLECNPDDLYPDRLKEWRQAGINRLSIGIQSFSDDDLSWMNRAHDAKQALHSIEMVRKAGFENFSIDLIYGLPGLTDEKWGRNLHTAISASPNHISCYALTVEPKTALYKMIRLKETENIKPEKQAAQFLTCVEMLEAAGFEHYEISSFAKPGKRSRHNSAYWQSKKYLGLGPGAHSFNGSSRQWNISNNALYIQSVMNGRLNMEFENLLPKDLLNEYIMTSLRTNEGMDLQYVAKHFGKDKSDKLVEIAADYIHSNKMEQEREKLLLTREGKLFADGIAAALFFD